MARRSAPRLPVRVSAERFRGSRCWRRKLRQQRFSFSFFHRIFMDCERCERTGRFPKRSDGIERGEASEETILNIADFAFPKRTRCGENLLALERNGIDGAQTKERASLSGLT